MTREQERQIRQETGKMSFNAWLEDQYGVTWSYWDNNYSGEQQDQMMDEYDDYLLS